MDNFEAIFEDASAAAPAIPPTDTAPVETAPQEVAAVEALPEVIEPAPQVTETAPPPRDDKFVPLAAMLDERDKRKALEAELAQFRASQPQETATVPDPYDDPAGYNAFVADMTNRAALAVKFDLSEDMAVGVHGEEAVNAAKEWGAQKAQSDPSFQRDFLAARNPIDWVVRQHRQADDLALYQRDPVAFAKAILERNGQPLASDTAPAATASAGQQPQAIRPVVPPRSIASAPASGGARDVAMGPLSAVDALFSR